METPKTPEIHNYDTQPDERCPHCGVKMEMSAIRWDVTTLATNALEKWNTRVNQS